MAAKYQPPSWCKPPRNPDDARQELRFLPGEASAAAPPRALELSDRAVYTIGRSEGSDVQLKGELASRMHAAVLQDADGGKFLVDLKSANGTFLASRRLAPHAPEPWPAGAVASFGYGPKAELVELSPPVGRAVPAAGGGGASPSAKRRRAGEEAPAAAPAAAFSLYDDLPEARRLQRGWFEEARMEPAMPVERDPTKIIFLDIDGCLRPLHSRQDAFKNAKTMEINGIRVPLLGSGEAKAGIDFWPSALRALKQVVQKTGARIVLSSDWRKEEVLRDGIAAQFEEHRIPPLFGQTPDLDAVGVGVLKAIHTSFREKRCKEIRKWLKAHPKVTRWVAITTSTLVSRTRSSCWPRAAGAPRSASSSTQAGSSCGVTPRRG
ncbi:unnamed protein product [Prorocentrum cordatum]|uniref:FHA domain-containing protein n=1 Tax=Prorocentrum cordatum TaxID=2364126 RepID=A0ABN9W3K7_9DINO|nr:unnamed protein product [Polarella glacialis]